MQRDLAAAENLKQGSTRANVFFSILQEAGKPASLRMTRFDLPEAYGIIDQDFRTKKMGHVVSRFRLASASRAARKQRQISVASTSLLTTSVTPLLVTAPTRLGQAPQDTPISGEHPNECDEDIRIPQFMRPGDISNVVAVSQPCADPPHDSRADGLLHLLASHEPFVVDATIPQHPAESDSYVDLHHNSPGLSSALVAMSDPMFDSALPLVATRSRAPVAENSTATDPPANPLQEFESRRVILPLSKLHLDLLRPEPVDPVTGASRLKTVQHEMLLQWLTAHVRIPSSQMDPLRIPSSASTTHPASALRNQSGSPVQLRTPGESSASISPRNSESRPKATVHLHSPLPPIGCTPRVLHPAQVHPLDEPHGEPYGGRPLQLTLHDPFADLSHHDAMSALLQSFHYSQSGPNSKKHGHTPLGWLQLAACAESHVFNRHQSNGGSDIRQSLLQEAATKASVLKESAADPSLLLQRMLGMQLADEELTVLRGRMNLCCEATRSNTAVAGIATRIFSTTPGAGLGKLFKKNGKDDAKLAIARSGGKIQLKDGSGVTSRLCEVAESNGDAPRDSSSFFPTSLLKQSGFEKGTCLWNAAFQQALDVLSSPSSIPAALSAHQRLVAIHNAFNAACGCFVERCLLSRIIPEVQLVHDDILFSLITLPRPSPINAKGISTSTTSIASGGLLLSEASMFPAENGDEGTDASDYVDDEEGARKMSSAAIRALSCFSRFWYKSAVHDSSLSPFANDENLSDLLQSTTPNAACNDNPFIVKYIGRETRRSRLLSTAAAGSHHPLVAEHVAMQRDTVFPLSCAVHYLGFVVHCSAKFPASVEQTAAPTSRTPRQSNLLSSVGREIGVFSYVNLDQTIPDGDGNDETENSRAGSTCRLGKVDLSRHVVLAEYRSDETTAALQQLRDIGTTPPLPASRLAVIAAPTIFPSFVPTMHYSRWLRLRPEFCAQISEELPSDVFSASVTSNTLPQKGAAQALAIKAARKLLHKMVTDLVQCWETSAEPLKGDDLCEAMHQRGINMSLLGYIGDLLDTKMKSIAATIAGAGHKTPMTMTHDDVDPDAQPRGDSNHSNGGGDSRGRALDALTKALTTVKEEMVVRTFRAHWNQELRQRCVATAGRAEREEMIADLCKLSTDLVRQLLGNESDPVVSTFWGNIINEQIKVHFRFRAPLGRKDISLRTTLHRLERLCGIVVSAGTERDALNPALFRKHEELLSVDLRSTRAIAIGSVVELRPYVKGMTVPQLPPLWRLQQQNPTAASSSGDGAMATSDGAVTVSDIAKHQQQQRSHVDALLRYLEKAIAASTEATGWFSPTTLTLEMRLAETLFVIGEHRYEACEHLLVQLLRRLQRRAAPMYHESVGPCLCLSRLLFAAHRHLDATRCADDALCAASIVSHSVFQTEAALLFATLHLAAREGGNRELAIHTLERCVVHCVRRLEMLTRDPYAIHLSWRSSAAAAAQVDTCREQMDPIQRQIIFEQVLLGHSIYALIDAYKAISYHTLHEPMAFHESVATPFFVKFLFELACAKSGCAVRSHDQDRKQPDWGGLDLIAAQSLLTRVLHLAEILQLRCSEPGSEVSQVVERCRANLAAVIHASAGSF